MSPVWFAGVSAGAVDGMSGSPCCIIILGGASSQRFFRDGGGEHEDPPHRAINHQTDFSREPS